MSEAEAYGLLMSTLDDLELVAVNIKAQRDEAVKLLREFCPRNPKVAEFLERLKDECAVTSH